MSETPATQPPKRPPLPPAKPRPPGMVTAAASAATTGPVQFGKIGDQAGHRIVLFGPGGIGKTTLAATSPGPVAFLDLDESLRDLKHELIDVMGLDLRIFGSPSWGWQDIRDALHAPGWDDIRTIVMDSATRAEELAVAWTLANVKTDKGATINNVEGYGWGKGYRHVYDTFLALLADLDQHARAGRNVILVCHDCTSTVPNPAGADWIRYEPRLQHTNQGSIRLRVREWASEVWCFGYDIVVSESGKGTSSGTRSIYPNEKPFCMAKSRHLSDTFEVKKFDARIWAMLNGKGD